MRPPERSPSPLSHRHCRLSPCRIHYVVNGAATRFFRVVGLILYTLPTPLSNFSNTSLMLLSSTPRVSVHLAPDYDQSLGTFVIGAAIQAAVHLEFAEGTTREKRRQFHRRIGTS